jgi:shikimate kinase
MQKVILVGYMAVGKTTIAQLLAQKIKWNWIDLDSVIENKTNLLINTIFEQKGEIYFRKIEHEIFKELIENDEKLIISAGGGTPCYANNHLFLNRENVVSIYLKASIEILFERLKNQKVERPLVANQTDAQLKEFIAKNLFDRSFFYNQATHIIDISTKKPEEVVDTIVQKLN